MYPQCWGDRNKQMTGAPWPASQPHRERRASVRDPASKTEGGGSKADRKDSFWEMMPKIDAYPAAVLVCARAHRH